MKTFLDSSFFVGLLNTRDRNHEESKAILRRLKEEEYGTLVATDYILDEVITTVWAQTNRKEPVRKAYRLIYETPRFVNCEKVSDQMLGSAWEKWEKYAEWPKKPLSFTDCTILAFMESENVEYLVTFDSEFNGIVETVR
jgi:predicted nucleic acid-binding protein